MENGYFGGESDNTGQMQWNQKEKWLDTNHMLQLIFILIYLLFMAFVSIKERLKIAFCGISQVLENVSIYFSWWCVAQDYRYWRHKSNDFSNFLFTLLPCFFACQAVEITRNGKTFHIYNQFWGHHIVSAITRITTEMFKIPECYKSRSRKARKCVCFFRDHLVLIDARQW